MHSLWRLHHAAAFRPPSDLPVPVLPADLQRTFRDALACSRPLWQDSLLLMMSMGEDARASSAQERWGWVACRKRWRRPIDSAIARVVQHCGQVRKHLKRVVVSVHNKRKGRVALGCVGGAMIGLDLSRAFDKLPRWALQASLGHASVEPAVCRAVIAIHERCSYKIKHGPFEDCITMKRGIRQGCALFPSLYTIFTIWIFD